jgi:hypothetical protein
MVTEKVMSPRGQDERRPGLGARVLGGLGVLVAMVAGIFILGRLASNDLMAMAITTLFFGLVMVVIGVISWRQRAWLLPLGLPFVLVAAVAGVILGRPLFVDSVVDEQVVVADEVAGVEVVATGSFEALSHPGRGTATLLTEPDGTSVVTLTDFETDNGPDVRVYLSRGTDADGRGASFIDLGAMKGNKGDQQYAVPADVDLTEFDAVVLWCRAFDVGFTQAPLTTA